MSAPADSPDLLTRYDRSLLRVFGTPSLVLDHGEGAWVWDVDGNRYLDLLGGIAVNVLGHAHPDLVATISTQAARLLHISNFYTSAPQIELAERLLDLAGAPSGSAVFFGNSGTEAIEAAVKLARRTGRTEILAAEGGFHGRSTGALALTHKHAYREPFAPLIPGVRHIPYGDAAALRSAVSDATAALVLEPIQGEGGVLPADTAYLRLAREVTEEHGALLILDEIQTGVGRSGEWFAHQAHGINPDAMTLAKGLGGGVPIGALVTYGESVTSLLGAGQHGSTFGGNPLACVAGLTVLDVIARDGLRENARALGTHLQARVAALDSPRILGSRGAGLLQGILLADPVAREVADAAAAAGFLVNPVAPDVLRLAPALVLTADELDLFLDALPGLVEHIPTAISS